MRIECPVHGKVFSTQDDKPKFCPICGKKVVCIWFLPKIYVEKEVIGGAFSVACAAALLFLLVIPGVRGCNAQEDATEKAKQEKIARMRPAWHNLYIQVKASSSDQKIVESFIAKNKNEL